MKYIERNRIAFIKSRDGQDGATAFVKQTYAIYRRTLKQRNAHGRRVGLGAVYRREFIESCLVFREYLRNNPVN